MNDNSRPAVGGQDIPTSNDFGDQSAKSSLSEVGTDVRTDAPGHPVIPPGGTDVTLVSRHDTPPRTPANTARYEFIDFVARGGMGEVWRARDLQLQREVAIKVLRQRTGASAPRFRAEAELVARLEHPSIVPIYDAGALPDGRPYFAMKLIRGAPNSDRKSNPPSTLAELLSRRAKLGEDLAHFVTLFQRICEAVAYAHALTPPILHRDLKPANVMVGLFGEVLVVDWGIAKVLQECVLEEPPVEPASLSQNATDPDGLEEIYEVLHPVADSRPMDVDANTLTVVRPGERNEWGRANDRAVEETRTGSAKGTLSYMAPEQARGDKHLIGTASDVFALGGILCAILTGKPPFAGSTIEAYTRSRRGDLSEVHRRLSECEADAGLVAIARKCLSAEPAERYSDAAELGRAVANYRADVDERLRNAELDRVRADSELRRAEAAYSEERKRQRITVRLGVAIVLALLLGGGLASWQWRRANSALQRATDEEARTSEALDRETGEKLAKVAALESAETARQKTVKTLRALTDQAVRERIGNQVAITERERKFLADVLALWKEVASTRGDTLENRALRAEGAFRVGSLLRHIGDLPGAKASLHESLELWSELEIAAPANPQFRRERAVTHRNMARLMDDMGDRKGAEIEYRTAIDMLTTLVKNVPDSADYLTALAWTYGWYAILLTDLSRRNEAEKVFRTELDLYDILAKKDPLAAEQCRQNRAKATLNLAILLRDQGRGKDAEPMMREALSEYQSLARRSDDDPGLQEELAGTHNALGVWLFRSRRVAEAEQEFKRALAIRTALASRYPAIPEYAQAQSRAHNSLGVLLAGTKRLAEAEVEFRAVLDIRKALTQKFPDVPQYQEELARAHHHVGNVLRDQKKSNDVEAHFREAIRIFEGLATHHPNVVHYSVALGGTYCDLANFWKATNPARTIENCDRAIEVLKEVVERESRLVEGRRFLRNASLTRARALGSQDRHADAMADWNRALDMSPEELRTETRIERGLCLVRIDAPAALAEVDDIAKQSKPTADSLYDFARICAIASSRDVPQRERLALRAVGYLKQSIELGFTDVSSLEEDREFASIRAREDFRSLRALVELKKSKGTVPRKK